MKKPFNVNITRSKNRRKTVSARLIGDVIEVRAPLRMSQRELNEIVVEFQKKFRKERLRENLNHKQDLRQIAQRLNREYLDGKAKFKHIEYATNLKSVYGYCDLKTREIKLSHVLAKMPKWVRDYVIVHELVHLLEANHNKHFWKILNAYPLTERARGFLIAKGLDEEEGEEREELKKNSRQSIDQTEFKFS